MLSCCRYISRAEQPVIQKLPEAAEWFGQQYADSELNFVEIYKVSQKIAEAGLPADTFLLPAVSKQAFRNEVISTIREKDKNEAIRLARLFSVSVSDLDEAVPLIYLVRNKNLALKEVFPDGIEIKSFDLKQLNWGCRSKTKELEYPSAYRYLILSRIEKDEPFEGEKSKFGSQPINPIGKSYDGNDKYDPSTFTIKIETALMDRIPQEHLPAEKDECDLMIVMDMQFSLAGSIEHVYKMSGSPIYEYSYYPTYSRIYSIAMVERKTNIPEYYYNSLEVKPKSVNQQMEQTGPIQATMQAAAGDSALYNRIMNSSTYKNPGESLDKIREVYLAPEKSSWFETNMNDFLDMLENVEWNNHNILVLKELVPAAEE